MRNILTICGKEVRSYFNSPIAYILIGLFGLLSGFMFYSATVFFINMGTQQQMTGQSSPMSINDIVIAPLLGNLGVISLFLIPMMAMRLFAEEKKSGTIELLLTSPLGDWEIILGKFFGALIMYAALIGPLVINVALLFAWSTPDFRPILTGFLGLALQGATILAIGTFISTTTSNQIIAAAVTFAICLLLWVLNWVSSYSESAFGKALAYCSILVHFEPFSKGIIDTKDVIFYLSAIFLGLFLTARSLESLRWRA